MDNMTPDQLAIAMIEWGKAQEKADKIKEAIIEEVLKLKKTKTVGSVIASYSKGRRAFDYELPVRTIQKTLTDMGDEAGVESLKNLIAEMTTTTVSVDWRKVCSALRIKGIETSPGTPSVSLKILE